MTKLQPGSEALFSRGNVSKPDSAVFVALPATTVGAVLEVLSYSTSIATCAYCSHFVFICRYLSIIGTSSPRLASQWATFVFSNTDFNLL